MTLIERNVLAAMSDHEHDWDGEIACEGLDCWIGDRQISRQTVRTLLRHLAIRDVSDVKGLDRYTINDTGKAILRRPDLADEIARAVIVGQPFTVEGDRVVELAKEQP